jgi:hypothetical protein
MKKIGDCGFKLLPHPPFPPDLATSRSRLFPHIKNVFRGKLFSEDDEIEETEKVVLRGLQKRSFGRSLLLS